MDVCPISCEKKGQHPLDLLLKFFGVIARTEETRSEKLRGNLLDVFGIKALSEGKTLAFSGFLVCSSRLLSPETR
jgi:hypothetical protein